MWWFRTSAILLTFISLITITFILNINMRNLYNRKTAIIISNFIPYIGNNVIDTETDKLYEEIGLKNVLDKSLFEHSLIGYRNLVDSDLVKKKSLITIIDYTRPSSEKRLYVIDLYSGKLLFNSLVAHGKNTGVEYARSFSNEVGSLKSSIGFFITMDTYDGENGYSLKLKGLEEDINDNAEERYIVMHGAEYVSEDFIKENGRIGRSWGCPAIPVEIADSLIDTIKGGSPLFIYSKNSEYLHKSKYLNIKTASNQSKHEEPLL